MPDHKIYRSKIGVGLASFVGAVLLIVFVIMIVNSIWIGFIINFLTTLFIIYTLITTKYTINKDKLRIQCGFLYDETVTINNIISMTETRNPLSSPAASLDRLELKLKNSHSILISPKEKDEFIDHILQINPEVEVNLKNK
jgi:hypothetical protein